VGNPDERVALPGYGADLAAPIWHDYMMVAASQPCDEFPEPENPAELSPYYSEHTSSSSSSSDSSDYDSSYDTTTTTPTTTTYDAPTDGTADDGNYDPDLYAPGAGQEPLPAAGGGNGQGPPAAPPGNAGGVDTN
ncbi:MAG TPA: hypothetical protein VK326_09490, partial [Solirubrobacterales bacterium]|nr:hypothetical protein [Solirubrobacterales bacterium]